MPGRLIQRTWQYNPTIYAPAKYKRACRYDAFEPDLLSDTTVMLDANIAGLVSEAERAIQTLNHSDGAALAPLARLLLRTESIASSKIEGMQVGVKELAKAEARITSGSHASGTAVEVLANIDAMILALDEASRVKRFGKREIIAIHARLMQRAENKRVVGRVRTDQNWIGGNDYNPCGADFVPPPPEEIDRLLDDLCTAINEDQLPPLVQAALVHAQFESIHPFEDGNGRTGRALIHVVLRRRRIAPAYVPPLSVVLASAKQRYVNGLTSFRGESVNGWIEYFASAAAHASHLAIAYLAAVDTLGVGWIEKLAKSESAPRAGAAAWALIDILPAHPVLTATAAIKATGRARAAVYEAIGQLIAAGILLPLSKSRRNQSWEVHGLLDLIGAMDDGSALA